MEQGASTLVIHRNTPPDQDLPPPLPWMTKEAWRQLGPSPIFQIRETGDEIFVSMTTRTEEREKISVEIRGKSLHVKGASSQGNESGTIALFLPPKLSPTVRPSLSLTNGVLSIRIRKAPSRRDALEGE